MKLARLLRGGRAQYASALGIRLVGAGLMFLMNVWLARAAGPQTYGIVAVGLAWGLFAMNVGSLGFSISSIRFVAAYTHAGRDGQLRSFLTTAILMTLAGGVLGGLAASGAGFFGAATGALKAEASRAYYMAVPLILIFPLLDLTGGIQRGFDGVARALIPYNLVFPILVIATTACAVFLRNPVVDLGTAFLCLYAGAVGAILLAVGFLMGRWPHARRGDPAVARSEWIKTSLATLPSSASSFAIRQIDAIILSFFVAPTEIAFYWLAGRIVRFASFGLQAAHMVASPEFARLRQEAEALSNDDIRNSPEHRAKMQAAASRAARATAVMALPSILLLAVASPYLLEFAGASFQGGLPIIYIMLCGEAFNVFCGPNAALMNMTGLQNELAKISILVIVAYALLIVVGAATFGIVGAAAAVSATIILQNLAVSRRVYRAFGVNTTMLSRAVWNA